MVPPCAYLGFPIPKAAHAGLEGLGCIHRCVGVAGPCVSLCSRGASLSRSGPGRTRGTPVYLPLRGSGWTLCILVLPRGVPVPRTQVGPGGLGCIRRCVGVARPWAYLVLPRGVPIPKRPTQARGDSGVSADVWEWLGPCIPRCPTGRPYPRSSPIRTNQGIVACAVVWEWLDLVYRPFPTGGPYPPSGPGRTGGIPVYPPMCGSGWPHAYLVVPRGVPIPQATQA